MNDFLADLGALQATSPIFGSAAANGLNQCDTNCANAWQTDQQDVNALLS